MTTENTTTALDTEATRRVISDVARLGRIAAAKLTDAHAAGDLAGIVEALGDLATAGRIADTTRNAERLTEALVDAWPTTRVMAAHVEPGDVIIGWGRAAGERLEVAEVTVDWDGAGAPITYRLADGGLMHPTAFALVERVRPEAL